MYYFNSRPYVRGDMIADGEDELICISIHAPT